MKLDGTNAIIIDSSSNCLNIYLLIPGAVFESSVVGKKHANVIMSSVENLLNERNIRIEDIGYVGVVVGPGSFTGIRIGVATSNALSKGVNARIVEINALESILFGEKEGVALLDAGNDNFYSLCRQIGKEDVYLFSNREEINRLYGLGSKFFSGNSKENIIALFREKVMNHEVKDIAKPFYMRLSSAERVLESLESFSVILGDDSRTLEVALIEKEALQEPWTERQIYDEMQVENGLSLFLIDNKNSMVGFVFARILCDELEILRIGILERFRRKGCATQLMSNLINRAKDLKIKQVYLEVSENNQNAIKFYEKQGFSRIGFRKEYYKNNMGALLYRKIIL